ncbi:DUF485 domain-containing protein [Risungbinella massiliensis]|uniref:DUF485 domain-containing protein n=1 Tax=Risungbinella massiliensis TaxID=1329796 RepID=UPI0005CB8CE3|nr:DUF485 domain-containing protein [Risungbinella massiliensis]
MEKIAKSSDFQLLLKKKKAFIVPMSIFFFLFYFALPIFTSYFTFLNKPAIGSISWAWVFAFLQFIMTWACCIVYNRKAKEFDQIVDQIKENHQKEGEVA